MSIPAPVSSSAKRLTKLNPHSLDRSRLGNVVQSRHHTVLHIRKQKAQPVNYQTSTAAAKFLSADKQRTVKRGIASWYGPGFHGKKTATGEIFDMFALSAAHKTLPIPSYAQITNLENQRTVIVRVNDRGPFVGNRVLDLSYAAAKKLDMDECGLGKVEIKPIDFSQALAQAQKTQKQQSVNIYLQVGRFGSERKALKLKNKITEHHLPSPKIKTSKYKTSTLYNVRLGPIDPTNDADSLHEQLAKIGITDPQIVTETRQN